MLVQCRLTHRCCMLMNPCWIDCRLFIGLAGLATDQQTFYEKLRFRMAMYSLREERDIKPASFGKLVSSLLYEKRFGPYFIEPVIAGLDRSCFGPSLLLNCDRVFVIAFTTQKHECTFAVIRVSHGGISCPGNSSRATKI